MLACTAPGRTRYFCRIRFSLFSFFSQGGVRIMYHIRTTWYQLVCTWYKPAPKIPICRYLCTRATSPPKKKTEGLSMKLLQKNKIKINNLNTELCHHRPRSKAHSNEYDHNADKAEQSLLAWRGAGRSSRGTKPLLSSSDGARSCRIRLPRDLWTCLLYTSPSPRD